MSEETLQFEGTPGREHLYFVIVGLFMDQMTFKHLNTKPTRRPGSSDSFCNENTATSFTTVSFKTACSGKHLPAEDGCLKRNDRRFFATAQQKYSSRQCLNFCFDIVCLPGPDLVHKNASTENGAKIIHGPGRF